MEKGVDIPVASPERRRSGKIEEVRRSAPTARVTLQLLTA